jgi:hypothetical protein
MIQEHHSYSVATSVTNTTMHTDGADPEERGRQPSHFFVKSQINVINIVKLEEGRAIVFVQATCKSPLMVVVDRRS